MIKEYCDRCMKEIQGEAKKWQIKQFKKDVCVCESCDKELAKILADAINNPQPNQRLFSWKKKQEPTQVIQPPQKKILKL